MSFSTRPELRGTFGMVASTHWLASAAGMAVLEQGGNAFDAAVAAGLVLQVTEPHLNGPGGEVPIIAHAAGRGETFVLCGQGTAPAAATPRQRFEAFLKQNPAAAKVLDGDKESLFKQFQAWDAENNARAQARPEKK